MAEPIVNPEIPYVGEVPGGLKPGQMIRLQGVTHPDSDRFNINFATGPSSKPRDDTALHISVRLNQGYIARNSYKHGSWGDEQGSGSLPIGQAQSFEILILVDPNHYKIAVNGQHHSDFPHRIPYHSVSHLLIDGDVSITLISYEAIVLPGDVTSSQASQLNAAGPQDAPPMGYGPPPGAGYGPPPGAGYGPPPGAGYGPPPNYVGPGYGPPLPPGAQPETETGGFLEKAQDILAGAIKSGAAEKLLGSILGSGGQQQQQQGYAHQNAQYGQYPHPPQQNQAGPMESLLSGLLGGGGGQQTQQQPHVPQVGGEGSVGGLGSVGGILGSLAGSFLRGPDQRH